DSPVSRGRLCPKGSASLQLTTGGSRQYTVRYRRPFGTKWEDLDLDTAMEMIADRVLAARRRGWQWEGLTVGGLAGALLGRRSRALSALSGASLLAASALTRFGIFEAGMASARDPRYTIVPQRQRQDGRI